MADVATSTGPSAHDAAHAARHAPWRLAWRMLLRLPLMLPKELRYLGVGATCAVFVNVLLVGLVALGIDYLWATLIAFPPALLVGYALHTVVTFGARFSRAGLARYGLTLLAVHPVWTAVLYILVDGMGLSVAIAAPIGTVIVFLLNFVGAHWAILRSIRAAFRLERHAGRAQD